MEEGFPGWMKRRGQEAARKLWKIATSEDSTEQQRERLLTWFAEMALGKARTMDVLPKGGSSVTSGVVILPAVMPEEQSYDAADSIRPGMI